MRKVEFWLLDSETQYRGLNRRFMVSGERSLEAVTHVFGNMNQINIP